MQNPEKYVEVLEEFLTLGLKGVKIDANREDWACLRMAAHCLGLPINAVWKKGEVFLLKKDE